MGWQWHFFCNHPVAFSLVPPGLENRFACSAPAISKAPSGRQETRDGVLTPGILCIPLRKKSRRDAGKKLLQSYSPLSQKIIINYTFLSVSGWLFPSFPRDLKNALPVLHRLSVKGGLRLTFFEVLQQPILSLFRFRNKTQNAVFAFLFYCPFYHMFKAGKCFIPFFQRL